MISYDSFVVVWTKNSNSLGRICKSKQSIFTKLIKWQFVSNQMTLVLNFDQEDEDIKRRIDKTSI